MLELVSVIFKCCVYELMFVYCMAMFAKYVNSSELYLNVFPDS